MRLDLFNVTGVPSQSVYSEVQELGYETKSRDELQKEFDGRALTMTLNLATIQERNEMRIE